MMRWSCLFLWLVVFIGFVAVCVHEAVRFDLERYPTERPRM
jgi:hypothetical protein